MTVNDSTTNQQNRISELGEMHRGLECLTHASLLMYTFCRFSSWTAAPNSGCLSSVTFDPSCFRDLKKKFLPVNSQCNTVPPQSVNSHRYRLTLHSVNSINTILHFSPQTIFLTYKTNWFHVPAWHNVYTLFYHSNPWITRPVQLQA